MKPLMKLLKKIKTKIQLQVKKIAMVISLLKLKPVAIVLKKMKLNLIQKALQLQVIM